MFKLFFKPLPSQWPKNVFSRCTKPIFWSLNLFLLASLCGCLTGPPLPKVNLADPGWNIRQGQAVWQPRKDAPEIAGDLLLASRADGSTFIQFTKTPFPFAIAQTSPKGWQIDFPPQNRHYAAPGSPPARIIWFQLGNAVTGKPTAKHWTWQNSETNWQLKNSSSGESLDGYFTQ